MAMSRKPLSERAGNSRRPHGGKVAKKARYPFCLLNRAKLVATLKENIVKPSTSLTEDDLMNPSPEKVQQIYLDCLEFVFAVRPESLRMNPSLLSANIRHPELMEEFVYRFQFFKVVKQFLQTCLVTDFKLEDLMAPESKRTCRNLSAIVNFIKFHLNVFLEAGGIQDYYETRDQLKVTYGEQMAENEKLQQQMAAMEKQKKDERELEQELKARINQQEQEMQALQQEKDSLERQYQEACEEKARSEQRLAELNKQLERFTQRDSDLRKQLVSSPDKLKARLRHLQKEMGEAKEAGREMEVLLRTWESLVSRAHHLPPLLTGLNEDLHRLSSKVESRDELQDKVEGMEEQLGRQKQLLREATAKYQNLVRHLKLIQAESARVMYDDTAIPHPHSTEELHRDVCLLEQELAAKRVHEEKVQQDLEVEKQKLAENTRKHQHAVDEIKEMTEALTIATQSQFSNYGELMVRFGLDLYKGKKD